MCIYASAVHWFVCKFFYMSTWSHSLKNNGLNLNAFINNDIFLMFVFWYIHSNFSNINLLIIFFLEYPSSISASKVHIYKGMVRGSIRMEKVFPIPSCTVICGVSFCSLYIKLRHVNLSWICIYHSHTQSLNISS